MVSKTNEQALEAAIEKGLAGICKEELALGEAPLNYNNDLYLIGSPSDFDKQYALDTRLFWQFLEDTQASELEKLKRTSPHDWQRKILERFDRMIKRHGVLRLLKKRARR